MSRGGARVRSGPAQDPMAVRRRGGVSSGFVHLPAGGREGDTPIWPLPGKPAKFKVDTWEQLWHRPEAVMWERLGMEIQVALYIEALVASMKPGAPAARMATVMSLQDQLGLSVAGRAKNRWLTDDAPQAPSVPKRAPTSTAKDRLALLQGGADARAS